MTEHGPHIRLSDHPMSIADAVALTSGELSSGSPDQMITHATTLEHASHGAICFAENTNAFLRLADEQGVTCLTTKDTLDHIPDEVKTRRKNPPAIILVDRPKDRFAYVMEQLYPKAKSTGYIHPMSSVASDAIIGDHVQIDAFVEIGSNVRIGDNSIIKSGTVIGDDVIIGTHVLVMPHVHIEHAVIGDHVQICSGSVIGNYGFGISSDGRNRLVPHIGRVIIGDHSHIGGLNTIDRGMLDDTVIGQHVMTDNQCHIAHNVQIGNGNIICGKVGIAGSVVIGERNIFGPEVGVASHITIGAGNLFASRSGITKDIGNGHVMGGFPAVPMADYRLQVAGLRRLARELKSKARKE